MAKTLSVASEEYVKLVNEVVAETGLDRMGVDFQVYNLLKTKNEVVRVQKANEIAEILYITEMFRNINCSFNILVFVRIFS